MTKITHEFEVILSRINEGPRGMPYETFHALSVSVGPDGRLEITTANGSKSIDPGLWDGFALKRRSTVHNERP